VVKNLLLTSQQRRKILLSGKIAVFCWRVPTKRKVVIAMTYAKDMLHIEYENQGD